MAAPFRSDELDLLGRDRSHDPAVIDPDNDTPPPVVVLVRPRTPTQSATIDATVDGDERVRVGMRIVVRRSSPGHDSGSVSAPTHGYTPRCVQSAAIHRRGSRVGKHRVVETVTAQISPILGHAHARMAELIADLACRHLNVVEEARDGRSTSLDV